MDGAGSTYRSPSALRPRSSSWPPAWNGQFIVYGHGYTFAGLPLSIPAEVATLAPFVLSQGFAFASSSYRVNGLAIKEGTEDMAALATLVRQEALAHFGATTVPVLITGASEGGAVTTLAAEQYPGVFQGALSTCGPTGNFQRQIDYLGDFNVLFNYFFPDVFQGKVTPDQCGLFGNECTPIHPIGPCMVSSEGTCAAWYKYNRPAPQAPAGQTA